MLVIRNILFQSRPISKKTYFKEFFEVVCICHSESFSSDINSLLVTARTWLDCKNKIFSITQKMTNERSKVLFSRSLFTIMFRPEMQKISTIFHFDQENNYRIYHILCVNLILHGHGPFYLLVLYRLDFVS